MGNIGAGRAATALSQMTGAPIHIGVPIVSLLPVEEISSRAGDVLFTPTAQALATVLSRLGLA